MRQNWVFLSDFQSQLTETRQNGRKMSHYDPPVCKKTKTDANRFVSTQNETFFVWNPFQASSANRCVFNQNFGKSATQKP
ncbi:hypothetical protein L596_028298 [Steinernema carpocapsae]|uniref:Uncharacterized protein n=1 Tax=Steinernema carpocapsae TaxID=34508 RepID=A0A4U5LY12_STECR|nr:hypothetical protein L596_028298 [Steinernema carpocapsae]